MNEIDLLNKVVKILEDMMDEIYILKEIVWESYNNENRN